MNTERNPLPWSVDPSPNFNGNILDRDGRVVLSTSHENAVRICAAMNASLPQPIATAPRDRTALLTDCGIARPLTDGEKRWHAVSDDRWALCYRSGDLIEDSDYGPDRCDPKLWVPLPDWMK